MKRKRPGRCDGEGKQRSQDGSQDCPGSTKSSLWTDHLQGHVHLGTLVPRPQWWREASLLRGRALG